MRGFRIWLFALALFVMFAPSLAFAIDIPPRQGHVQDLAGMLTPQGAAGVGKAAAGGSYQFYVLTVDSLKGKDASVCAACVYKAWQLEENEMMILLSKNDRRIEMSFRNPALLQALDALPPDYDGDGNKKESKIDELVGKHFTPRAKQGDFAGGLLALIAATNRFAPAAEIASPGGVEGAAAAGAGAGGAAGTAAAAGDEAAGGAGGASGADAAAGSEAAASEAAPGASAQEAAAAGSAGDGAGSEPAQSEGGAAEAAAGAGAAPGGDAALTDGPLPDGPGPGAFRLPITGEAARTAAEAAAATAALAGGAAQALAYGRARRRLAAVQGCAGRMFRQLNLLRDRLAPIAAAYEGELTRTRATELAERIDSGTNALLRLTRTMADYRLPVFRRDLAAAGLTRFEASMNARQIEVDGIDYDIGLLMELEQWLARTIPQMTADLAAARQAMEHYAASYGLPLGQLRIDLLRMDEAVAAAESHRGYDLVLAERELTPAVRLLERISPLLARFPELRDQAMGSPDQIATIRVRVDAMMREAGLILAERFNPARELAEAAALSRAMPADLGSGAVIRLAAAIERVRALLEQAVRDTQNRAVLQKEVRGQLHKLASRLRELPYSEAEFTARLRRTQAEFARREWHGVPERHAALKASLQALTAEAALCQDWCQTHVQRYDEACTLLAQASDRMGEAETDAAFCMNVYQAAVKRFNALKEAYYAQLERYEETNKLAFAKSLPQRSLERIGGNVSAGYRRLETLIASRPADLQQIEAALASFDNDLQEYATSLRRLIAEKEQADRELRDLERKFSRTRSRASSRLKVWRYERDYAAELNEAERLMALGLYVEAIRQMAKAERVVDRMESAYQDVLSEERREQAAAAARSSVRSTSSIWSSSSSSGSSSSGGGDDSDSDCGDTSDNSSGGDNW